MKRRNDRLEVKNRRREAMRAKNMNLPEKALKGELNVIEMDNLLIEALESQKVLGLNSINEDTRKTVMAVNLKYDRVTAEL